MNSKKIVVFFMLVSVSAVLAMDTPPDDFSSLVEPGENLITKTIIVPPANSLPHLTSDPNFNSLKEVAVPSLSVLSPSKSTQAEIVAAMHNQAKVFDPNAFHSLAHCLIFGNFIKGHSFLCSACDLRKTTIDFEQEYKKVFGFKKVVKQIIVIGDKQGCISLCVASDGPFSRYFLPLIDWLYKRFDTVVAMASNKQCIDLLDGKINEDSKKAFSNWIAKKVEAGVVGKDLDEALKVFLKNSRGNKANDSSK